jgi:hypothetical protein
VDGSLTTRDPNNKFAYINSIVTPPKDTPPGSSYCLYIGMGDNSNQQSGPVLSLGTCDQDGNSIKNYWNSIVGPIAP